MDAKLAIEGPAGTEFIPIRADDGWLKKHPTRDDAEAVAVAIGLPLARLLHGLREYRGEPHRVEMVANVGGVDYFDDSKGTNVGATVAALNGLGEEGREARLLLIAGGDGKGQDFSPLAEPVKRWPSAACKGCTDINGLRCRVACSSAAAAARRGPR